MNSSKLFALVLLALGVMAFAYQNLPDTTKEKHISPSNLPVAAETRTMITPATILGIIALAGGLVVLVIDRTEPVA